MFWAVSCIEMALKQKFEEVHPGPFELRRKIDHEEQRCRVDIRELEDKVLKSRARRRQLSRAEFRTPFQGDGT